MTVTKDQRDSKLAIEGRNYKGVAQKGYEGAYVVLIFDGKKFRMIPVHNLYKFNREVEASA